MGCLAVLLGDGPKVANTTPRSLSWSAQLVMKLIPQLLEIREIVDRSRSQTSRQEGLDKSTESERARIETMSTELTHLGGEIARGLWPIRCHRARGWRRTAVVLHVTV